MNKLTAEQFQQLTDKVADTVDKHSFLRLGQTWFNELYNINPELANEIRATELDPFYVDVNLPAFKKRISPEA